MSRDSSHPQGETPASNRCLELNLESITESDVALLAALHNSTDNEATLRDSQAAIDAMDPDIVELLISAKYLHELGIINLDEQNSKALSSQRACQLTHTGEPLAAAAADTICCDRTPTESLSQLRSEYLNQLEKVTGKQLLRSDGHPSQCISIRELGNITPGDSNGGQAGLSEFL